MKTELEIVTSMDVSTGESKAARNIVVTCKCGESARIDVDSLSSMVSEKRPRALSHNGTAPVSTPISVLKLCTASHNALVSRGISTIGDLITRGPRRLLKINRIGPLTIEAIRRGLQELGHKLR